MRVRDLRLALDEIGNIFGAAGARSQKKAFQEISSALERHDGEHAESYLQKVRELAEEVSAPPHERFIKMLAKVELDEERFLKVISELEADKKLKKAGLQKVAKAYVGSFERGANMAQLIDSIKLTFYTRLYERDASAMARRATPV